MLLRTCGRNVLDWKTSTAFCPNEGELVGLVMVLDTAVVFMDHGEDDHSEGSRDCLELKNSKAAKTRNNTETMLRPQARRSNVSKQEKAPPNWFLAQKDTEHVVASKQVSKACATARPQLCRPVSFDMTSQCLQRSQEQIADSRLTRLTSLSLGAGGWIRRSESTSSVTHSLGLSAKQGKMRSATSLPHIAKAVKSSTLSPSTWPCLLVALRPVNLEQEKHKFFQCDYKYDPQFKYAQPEPKSVLDKYCEGSDFFLEQAVGIMECVLKKFGSYENFEEVTGGTVLPKSQVWATVRKYLQKEGCVGEVVVRLSDELLSQAVMMVESCRPTLTINLAGARQHWVEGMLRHEIGCFSKDQVYLDGILRILRYRRNIDFKMLTSLGKVSFEDVEKLRDLAVVNNARIPYFMQDQNQYLEHLDHIVAVNKVDDLMLQQLLP
ncbi:microtubule-associated tyrosine carboxypeptidase isoform X4 [Syngnathoides biaculeatus]|uniref:microtubule-associated tyrosine carboxypeptidase isoform X4 n=1 Tax=Syngnathoides biaculeatus TaxID=300417 RepID=UPI002ADE58A6|nr:microtubule-associated tyrosine carboxypeptidase isoform X4 [Syngnathoides biaculeatus]